jgi:hypothetical protein
MSNQEEANVPTFNHSSTEVLKHLDMMQGIINRISDNSKSSKQWCVVLIAAIFAVVAKQGNSDFVILAFFPLVLFCFLDTYYLTLERGFIDGGKTFLDKLNAGTLNATELFIFKSERNDVIPGMAKAFTSLAIWPFYGLIGVMVCGAWCLSR